MTRIDRLLTRISAHCRRTGISETAFGIRVVNNGHLVHNLRAGKTITLKTLDKIEAELARSEKKRRRAA